MLLAYKSGACIPVTVVQETKAFWELMPMFEAKPSVKRIPKTSATMQVFSDWRDAERWVYKVNNLEYRK